MIPLFKPYMPQLPQLPEILSSGQLSYGSQSKQFEALLKKYFDTPNLLVTNTFSAAIEVALSALGLHPGDEIIASPMTCLVSAQPYLAYGLQIRWADIDPKRGTLSPDSVRKAITPSTRCIVHNHFCGYPGYIDEINAIGQEYGIPVIDDGIECFGSEYHGRKIGTSGAAATVFSLGPVRIPNTIDGGIVIFRDAAPLKKALLLRDCGIDRSIFRDAKGEISLSCDISLCGYSAMMSNVNGYIGCKQMEVVESLLQRQRQQASRWTETIAQDASLAPIAVPNSLPNYWVYGLLAANKAAALDAFRAKEFYASGVHSNLSRYRAFGSSPELPGVTEFMRCFLAIPCGWWM